MAATTTEQLARRAESIEKDLCNLDAGGKALTPKAAALLHEYRDACEDVIFNNFKFASDIHIERQLWQAHLLVNNAYRKHFRQLRGARAAPAEPAQPTSGTHVRRNASKDHVVELRKLVKSYIQFIKGSQKFYRQFILSLDIQYDGIPELRKIAQKWKDVEASKTSLRTRIPPDLKAQVLQLCHQTLIYLGDLSRYRETETVEKDRNWGPAKGYYELAAEIYPDDGQSHNQLAILSREDGNHFRTVYHLYRALSVVNKHPQGKGNLENEFKRIVRAWEKGELIHSNRSPDGGTAARALVAWFVRLHSKCYKGEEFAQYDELENEVTGQLAVQLKERSLDSILNKIILINMAAEYFSTVQVVAAGGNASPALTRTYFYYLRLNVKTFFTLLQVLQPELERLSEGDDVTLQNGDRLPQLSDKLTAVARRVLPGLRLYSTWFAKNWHILNANIADTLTTVEVQELWKAYAATLTLLVSSFPVDELPQDSYMLEEDTDTIGFQPLVSDVTKKLWHNADGSAKKKWSDLERNHPNIEMLMRVKDLLIDGLLLTQNTNAPLDLINYRFIYREAGLPSELLASPRTEAPPAAPAESMELPLFPQDAPVPEDQKSYSVAAPSDSASTTLAKDSAMNRMVDDLVGPDDGLDPLVEEDENIPPTPPAQTFEDTAKISDSTYGLASISISDIVNSVQNYKKPVASPNPAVATLSTPMNRVASSSSIRQPAHLPSLPDGQWNSNSIWNPNYTGTPGPSSPMLGNGAEHRDSPLMRSSVVSAHSRGDSAHSLRSVEHVVPAHASPVVSSGLGNGATWGNPSGSPYSSIYGNHSPNGNGFRYSQNGAYLQHGSAADYNLISQNLFPESVYSGMGSSYGRTPPNGQGG